MLIISEGTPAALPRSRAVSFRPDFWSPMFHTSHSDGYSLGIFVEENHPLFTHFPTGCFGDWQWFEPLQNARGLLVNDLPPALRPIVQPIASIDLPERLAMLFEARVGPGRLFVSTVDLLGKSDPASRALLSAVYRYVSGDEFRPQPKLEPEVLRAYLPPLDLTGIRLRGKSALEVGEPAARPIPLDGAAVSVSSAHPQHPAADLLRGDRAAFWQSNYLDRAQRLPQWVVIELPEPAEVSALLCGAWRESTRGAILRAALSVGLDGETFETVCRGEWDESAAGEDKLFAFPPRPARYLRLDVDWAVMHTGDSNAVSISTLALYNGPIIASAAPLPVCEVRFGTPLEQALAAAALPGRAPVTLADGAAAQADVAWTWEAYRPDLPGDYLIRGTLFAARAANPGGIYTKQIIRVRPKDMTTPPDKTALDRAYRKLQAVARRTADPTVRQRLDELLTQAESFYALTGAVQHDVDVWTDRLLAAGRS